MGLTQVRVRPRAVAASGCVRLAPRHHYLRQLAAPLMDALSATETFRSIATFTNGVNLPRSSYADDDSDALALYASVAPLASIAFRREACVPLAVSPRKAGIIAGTRIEARQVAVTDREVLITRSRASAPGLAWPGDLAPRDTLIVPSGFLIRAKLQDQIPPAYIAAILNHPAWRLLTAALAAGKSQDNLSQELLGSVPIPVVSVVTKNRLARKYNEALREIEALYDGETGIADVCDRVFVDVLGLRPPVTLAGSVQVSRVRLADVAATRLLRCDNRWHGPANRAVRQALLARSTVRLAELLDDRPSKGRQPAWLADEDAANDDAPYAITTGTIQSAKIVWDRAKPTTERSVERFPVRAGDLLVAMDGDGSLGKAAVYDGDQDATVDSHLARCRVRGGLDAADSVSCWLNSTWGHVQTTSLMTGSTGQTQLNPADLLDILVPSELTDESKRIASSFRSVLSDFEPVTRRARRILSRVSGDVTAILIEEGALVSDGDALSRYQDSDQLLQQLDLLYPSKRT